MLCLVRRPGQTGTWIEKAAVHDDTGSARRSKYAIIKRLFCSSLFYAEQIPILDSRGSYMSNDYFDDYDDEFSAVKEKNSTIRTIPADGGTGRRERRDRTDSTAEHPAALREEGQIHVAPQTIMRRSTEDVPERTAVQHAARERRDHRDMQAADPPDADLPAAGGRRECPGSCMLFWRSFC